MHGSANKIIEMFRGMRTEESLNQPGTSIADNPAKLCYVAKQCIREAAVGELIAMCEFSFVMQHFKVSCHSNKC